MATIQLILNAVNNASKGMLAVAASADAAANRIDALNAKIDATSAALGVQATAATVAAARMNDLSAAAVKAAAAQVAAGGAGRGLLGIWGLMGRVPLFGGMFSVAAWHAIADAVIEFGTTLVEAATAVVAFAAFATPTFQHIYVQLTSIWSASNALNTAIYPLKDSFSSLSKAVAPEAYELFGEALVLVNAKTGEFAKLASSAGLVLDQLGGRFVAAVDNGNTFNSFLGHATGSLSMWGDIVGNVGGILGNFFKVLPGYAYILTDALKGVTGALQAITSNGVVQWFMSAGLAVHGFILWVGLAATAALLLGKAVMSLAASFMATDIGAFVALLFQVRTAEDAVALSSMALDSITPLGWVAIAAAAALAGLIVLLHSSSSATQELTASIEQLVQNAPITSLGTTLSEAIKGTTQEMNTDAAAAGKLADQYANMSTIVRDASSRLGSNFNPALREAVNTTTQAQQGLTMFQQQADLVNSRVAALSKTYGGNAAAMGLMIQAGITSAQLTNKNTEAWKAAEVQIQAVADADAMALGEGRNAAAMNALNYAGDTTNNVLGSLDVDMQKVVTGMDDITNVVLGGEQAFYSFATGLEQFRTDAAATGAVLGTVTTAQGKLSAASITLGSDYYTTMLPAMQKTIDAMELQLPTTAQLTAATGDMARQLLPVAKGNQAAEASLITLINNALGPGTVSFQNLNKWVQQNGGSLNQLNQIIGQTTAQASVLANTLGSDLNAQFAQDILKTTGAQQALAQYTADLTANTQNTVAGQGDRAKLISDLIQAGMTAKQAAQYVQSLSSSLGKVQSPPPIVITIDGRISGNAAAVNYALSQGVSTSTILHAASYGAASGGYIRGPGSRTSDSIPARLSAGEYVVRADSVDKYGKQMMDLINAGRFARGGLVLSGALGRGYADGGEVTPSPLSAPGMPPGGGGGAASGPGSVTIADAVTQLKLAVQLLNELCNIDAAGVAAISGGQVAVGNAGVLRTMYSTRG